MHERETHASLAPTNQWSNTLKQFVGYSNKPGAQKLQVCLSMYDLLVDNMR